MGTMREKVEQGRANAQVALDAYYTTGNQDDDEVAAIRDLIEDLLHLAESKGVTPAEMDEWAQWVITDYRYEADPDNAEGQV